MTAALLLLLYTSEIEKYTSGVRVIVFNLVIKTKRMKKSRFLCKIFGFPNNLRTEPHLNVFQKKIWNLANVENKITTTELCCFKVFTILYKKTMKLVVWQWLVCKKLRIVAVKGCFKKESIDGRNINAGVENNREVWRLDKNSWFVQMANFVKNGWKNRLRSEALAKFTLALYNHQIMKQKLCR